MTTNRKNILDSDVDTVLVHADEFMAMIGKLMATFGVGWDHTVYTRQEIFDLYVEHVLLSSEE